MRIFGLSQVRSPDFPVDMENFPCPDAKMGLVYLPTFTSKTTHLYRQIDANRPCVEHLGLFLGLPHFHTSALLRFKTHQPSERWIPVSFNEISVNVESGFAVGVLEVQESKHYQN